MNFYTADLHFGHYNIIEYCDRPFKNALAHNAYLKRKNGLSATQEEYEAMKNMTHEMNKFIINKINSKVKKNDKLFIIGDIAMNSLKGVEAIRRINCEVVLILGNHDKKSVYEKAGVEIHDQLIIEIKDLKVKLCHYPVVADLYDGDKFDNKRPKDDMPLLHGHSHCHYLKNTTKNGFTTIDVGIDNGFEILSEDEIYSLLTSSEKYIPSKLTEFYNKKNN